MQMVPKTSKVVYNGEREIVCICPAKGKWTGFLVVINITDTQRRKCPPEFDYMPTEQLLACRFVRELSFGKFIRLFAKTMKACNKKTLSIRFAESSIFILLMTMLNGIRSNREKLIILRHIMFLGWINANIEITYMHIALIEAEAMRQYRAARTIQRFFRKVLYDPRYLLCRRRVVRKEFEIVIHI
jgi:hypothetical protein